MNVRANRYQNRSGITLTEILISIMIMGVGMVSLATLFPLGLLRLREANRMTRSALLAESAMADMGARTLLGKPLLSKQLFLNPYTNPFTTTLAVTPYDPWLIDTPAAGQSAYNTTTGAAQGATATWGSGLPVAYDPLWRALVPNSSYSSGATNFGGYGYYLGLGTPSEARFGSGLGYVRPDSSSATSLGGSTTNPSAHGLQRLTNFSPLVTQPYAPVVGPPTYPVIYPGNTSGTNAPNPTVASIFVSPEDIVFQNNVDALGKQNQNVSTIVPDMSGGAQVNDWRYTWMFTGHQADDKGTTFEGEIVVFENRPFAIDPVSSSNAPYLSTMPAAYQVAGETVVEGIFGYSKSVYPVVNNTVTVYYGRGADRTVLLRWPNTMPDPEVRVGSWIADVTYERDLTVSNNRFANSGDIYPGQRCHWYQIVKKSTPDDEVNPLTKTQQGGLGVSGFRSMTVWVNSPLKAKTLMSAPPGSVPLRVNAALVCPYVVNVFPRTIYMR